MVDFHVCEHAMTLEDPVDLFFIAPHHAPIIFIGFSPLPIGQSLIYAISEASFEFNIAGVIGIVLLLDVSLKILRHRHSTAIIL